MLDDWSTDDTEDVCRAFERRDPRFRYFRPEKKLASGAKTLNVGVSLCSGEWIACLDDDDAWDPRKLELQFATLGKQSRRVGLVTCWQRNYDLDKSKVVGGVKRHWSGDVYLKALGASGHIFGPPSAVLFSKELINEVGSFDEEMMRGACQDFFRRASKVADLATVPIHLLDYGVQSRSISSLISTEDLQDDVQSRTHRVKKFLPDLERVPSILHEQLRIIGFRALAAGDRETVRWATYLIRKKACGRSPLLLVMASNVSLAFALLHPVFRLWQLGKR